jgi:hypothetical protein
VAGIFYPSRPERMQAELSRLVVSGPEPRPVRAVVVPHAAWQYSGRVAGAVYGRIRCPRLAVVLGPNHTGLGPRGSVMARGRWALPGGDMPIAEDLADAILAATPVLQDDMRAHAEEHAVEVQLPFLRWLSPELAFVPIVLGRTHLEFCEEVGRALAVVIRGRQERVLLVCSTDLSHYERQDVSNAKDRLAIDAMLSLDPARLALTVREHKISMCGVGPAMATLSALRALGPDGAELVRYETSGDVSGDLDRVVGYAGLLLD